MILAVIMWGLIHGTSMSPTLENGRLYPFEAVTDTTTIERGDIVCYQIGDTRCKGVGAVPGDTLAVLDLPAPRRGPQSPVVPPGHLYMWSPRGWNSRHTGFIKREYVFALMRKERLLWAKQRSQVF